MPLHDQVICGDSREVLTTLPDGCIDAVCTDPPYALLSSRNGTTGFMGSHWDVGTVAHDSAFWAEVLRVAKPGAHLVAFGGTRTAHRLACAIEDAGWEIRDSLYLLWCHGQGFPKSLDISKAIDKMAGADRDVVGLAADFARDGHHRRTDGRHARPSQQVPGGDRWSQPVTIPSSDDAKQWDGWGTALKPSAEPIVLARKPLAEPTVAANVLAHGTGALHIDACRVATAEDQGRPRGTFPHSDDAWGNGHLAHTEGHTGGRWPPNTILSHHPDCRPAGVRRVRGAGWRDTDVGPPDKIGGAVYSGGTLGARGTGHHTDANGYETVDAYQCVEGCPVAALDAQAGPRTSGGTPFRRAGMGYHGAGGQEAVNGNRGDTGAVHRFFPTFAPDPEDAVPYFYTPKASRRERNAGLEGRPEPVAHDKVGMNGHGTLPRQTPNQHRPQANHHACVKPLALGRWLTRLVAAPGSVVLDPFCGSGSLSVAAVLEGCHYIAIDCDESYCAIARARIAYAHEQRAGPLFAAAEKDA